MLKYLFVKKNVANFGTNNNNNLIFLSYEEILTFNCSLGGATDKPCGECVRTLTQNCR